jgi:hypothetical protein
MLHSTLGIVRESDASAERTLTWQKVTGEAVCVYSQA